MELAGFVKILYLITGIFIIVTVYLIYQLLSTRPQEKLKFKRSPDLIFLDGHQQVIALMSTIRYLLHSRKLANCSTSAVCYHQADIRMRSHRSLRLD